MARLETAMKATRARVTGVFAMGESRRLVVHLATFDWDFSPETVRLTDGERSIEARTVGSGNHEGRAAVLREPHAPWDAVRQEVDHLASHLGKLMLVRAGDPASGDRP